IEHATGAVQSESSFRLAGQPRPFLELRHRDGAGGLRVIDDDRAIEYCFRHGLYCGLQVSVIRREVFEGYRFEAMKRNEAEDQLLVTHARARGRRLAYFDNVPLLYYIHEANSSATGTQSIDKHVRLFRALIEGYEALPRQVNFTARQRRAWKQRLCKEYFW